ncbi:hypothetical protein J6590_095300 [Homalodisca vitripennis]|nr:hypothetical protein J6590_095300 [Homalodisca vitripennis]
MHLDRGLTWNEHIDYVCAKVCSGAPCCTWRVTCSRVPATQSASHLFHRNWLISYGVHPSTRRSNVPTHKKPSRTVADKPPAGQWWTRTYETQKRTFFCVPGACPFRGLSATATDLKQPCSASPPHPAAMPPTPFPTVDYACRKI